jgi:deoxyribodipyrimidine photo-lyase
MAQPSLVLVRRDLRLADNPALSAALEGPGSVVALYIHETNLRRPTGAGRSWLNQSLLAHAARLATLGVPLEVLEGPTEAALAEAVARHGATQIFWNRRYGPAERAVDAALKARFRADGLAVDSFAGDTLVEPFTMETGTGKPYSVYTPFWKTLRTRDIARPLPVPPARHPIAPPVVDADYRAPGWAGPLLAQWAVGEVAAEARLMAFLNGPVGDYAGSRDFPALNVTSRLSPHMAFGEISPRQIWHAAKAMAAVRPEHDAAIEKFLSEVAWRDFNINQLYHRPDIAVHPMVEKFGRLPWRDDPAALLRWQRGQTGFPIVDAGMRELWQTGTMHNRVRMLVASLLTKNLMIDWRLGEAWFWDTLFDADPANNPGNWQWVAGTGLDASPYFRIFNPITQGERFDAEGQYVRRYVPELASLPNEWLHKPFEAPDAVLEARGIRLGVTYPRPMVDLKASRGAALEAFSALSAD